ncbi:MAG: hypothetical protein N4J56_000650 [Chroococcidiopsis sp. SAG 2025]|uniref:hypothetical protein n=1 Tax=Chroococcidiopsis sp. SAG 2025 TaxID=171389 RepID=UPI0029372AFB|nr:hypothetical protein [Chroococcidiopsis sp. SAG 2025]MDV2990996.1 hypothetical protein [Chroococcidiopsis sp. SAG 2025]
MVHGSIAPRQSQPPVGAGLANMSTTSIKIFIQNPPHRAIPGTVRIWHYRKGGFDKSIFRCGNEFAGKTHPYRNFIDRGYGFAIAIHAKHHSKECRGGFSKYVNNLNQKFSSKTRPTALSQVRFAFGIIARAGLTNRFFVVVTNLRAKPTPTGITLVVGRVWHM